MGFMDLFLGIPYCTGDQERFRQALKNKKYADATLILERLPFPSPEDKIGEANRNTVLAIGYREIVKQMELTKYAQILGVLEKFEIDDSEELEKDLDEIMDLREKAKGLENITSIL